MQFQALYYADRLHIINSHGDVGVVTLWTPPERVIGKLQEFGIDVDHRTSRIAVVANLFGKGLREMIRNLLWNPQILHLLILGQDLSGSKDDLVCFFKNGIERTTFVDSPAYRIIGRTRVVDGQVDPSLFKDRPRIIVSGKINDPETQNDLVQFFSNLPPQEPPPKEDKRINVPIPDIEVRRFPSEPRSHTIVRESPIEAWLELVFRLVRFGHWVKLRKGERRELQNVHVVVTDPREEPVELLERYGLSLEGGSESLRSYQANILDGSSPDIFDQSYTYGHRLRSYFGSDCLALVVERLKADPESRHCYISLWDSSRDLQREDSVPCLDSIFFRRFDDKLTLTATFRTHNAQDAWLKNFYALMAVQNYVAGQVNMSPGAITVLSRSISLQRSDMEASELIARSKKTDHIVDLLGDRPDKRRLRFDHNGDFTFTLDLDNEEIVAEHSYLGVPLAEYRGKSAEYICEKIARDGAISLISHALHVGRELTKAEAQLRQAVERRLGRSP